MTHAATPARLTVEGLDQHYGSAQVLRGVALAVEPGACLTVLGRNGAGKTTLLRCLTGSIPESRGRIALDGTDLTRLSPDRRARAGLAYVPQGREIFPDLSVAENLRIAARAHGLDRTGAVDEAVALFPALRGLWHRPGGNLSGGQQQQLAIARALATRPRALLLDEPTEGIQPSIVAAIEEVIAGLKGRITVLLVEQYLDFALRVADTVVVLSRGHVVARGDPGSLSHETLTRHIAV
ncbi:urea ABC transporter ATP-binding subunit UrtE [Methylobacterium sp. SD21]|uniref:urea ABC transporter ATP-binding subunit UrtE n=1 Tax=Methylobacterium litchii TaxID=3138810 RepID=UPI00313CF651